jgi:hypothetical protein
VAHQISDDAAHQKHEDEKDSFAAMATVTAGSFVLATAFIFFLFHDDLLRISLFLLSFYKTRTLIGGRSRCKSAMRQHSKRCLLKRSSIGRFVSMPLELDGKWTYTME